MSAIAHPNIGAEIEALRQESLDLLAKMLDVPVHIYINRALAIGARRLDLHRISHNLDPIHEALMAEVIDSQEYRDAFARGFRPASPIKENYDHAMVEFVQRVADSAHNLTHPYFLAGLGSDGTGRRQPQTDSAMARIDLLKQVGGSEHLQAAAFLMLVRQEAYGRQKLYTNNFLNFTDPGEPPATITPGAEKQWWLAKICGGSNLPPGIRECQGYVIVSSAAISQLATRIFGENSERAKMLLGATLFLRSKLRPPSMTLAQLRTPAFSALANGDTTEAEFQLKWLLFKHPELFGEKATKELDLTQADRSFFAEWEQETKKPQASETDKLDKILAPMLLAAIDRHERTSPESVEAARPLVGTTFVTSDFSALVFVRGFGIQHVQTTKLEIPQEARERLGPTSVPTLLVRRFAIDAESGTARFAGPRRIYPGELLQQISSGELISLGNIGDLTNVSRIEIPDLETTFRQGTSGDASINVTFRSGNSLTLGLETGGSFG